MSDIKIYKLKEMVRFIEKDESGDIKAELTDEVYKLMYKPSEFYAHVEESSEESSMVTVKFEDESSSLIISMHRQHHGYSFAVFIDYSTSIASYYVIPFSELGDIDAVRVDGGKVSVLPPSNKFSVSSIKMWIKELIDACGWDIKELMEDINTFDVDPSTKSKWYREIFSKYYREAIELAEHGDTRESARKIWGSATSLVKYHASKKGMQLIQWSKGDIFNYVSTHVEKGLREDFRSLLLVANALHEHYYEGYLDINTFNEHLNDATRLVDRVVKALGISYIDVDQ